LRRRERRLLGLRRGFHHALRCPHLLRAVSLPAARCAPEPWMLEAGGFLGPRLRDEPKALMPPVPKDMKQGAEMARMGYPVEPGATSSWRDSASLSVSPIGEPAQTPASLRSIATASGALRLSAPIPLEVHPSTPCGVRLKVFPCAIRCIDGGIRCQTPIGAGWAQRDNRARVSDRKRLCLK